MSRILRSDSSLFEVLLQEYHSDSGGSYRDVRIRFEDGSCLETSRLLLGSLSEILFESLSSIPSWEDAEILVPGLDPGRTRGLLESLLCVPGRSEWAKEDLSASQDVISALGLDAPPALEKRLRAYHCEDCDVHLPKEAILAHVRDFHPRSRKVVSSPIWSFFDPTEHPEFHRCRECKAVIKDKANSALISHLEENHVQSHEIWTQTMLLKAPDPASRAPSCPSEKEHNSQLISSNALPEYLVTCHSPLHPTGTKEEDPFLDVKEGGREYIVERDVQEPRAYICRLCPQDLSFKVYDNEDDLMSLFSLHIRSVHPELMYESPSEDDYFLPPEDKARECKFCSKRFFEEDLTGQVSHVREEHSAIDRRETQALKYFKSSTDFHTCILCSKVFMINEPGSLILHMQSDHSETWKDEVHHYFTLVSSEGGLPRDELPALGGNNKSGGGSNKRRSSIWNYFVSTGEHEMNACRVCNRVFKCKGQTTSSMIRHLKKEHVGLFHEFLENKESPPDPIELSLSINNEKKRSPVWKYFEKTSSLGVNACLECKTEFKCKGYSTSNMIRHLELTHPELFKDFLRRGGEEMVCSECGTVLANRAGLTQHMKIVHASSCPYKCEICNATFTRRESYEQHSHDKNKPRNFLCTICGKTFARRSIRDFHEKAHDAEKKYECSFCPKKFLTNQRRYKHERTHTGEKPYQCTDCGRQFTLSHHLATHSRIHSGQKPYSCNLCPQTFRHLSSKNNHKCEGKLQLNAQS
eukprot:TRINITY_DN1993_c0_g1_i1.p1 TRINITY_DN1993_c0_g1~~TRINITY_DN1993_c0_g1_i1.p1  ORF type:complete len:752 (-),score=166.77 TRINITY_DN1993_c0_g1_i1:66-2321(-)